MSVLGDIWDSIFSSDTASTAVNSVADTGTSWWDKAGTSIVENAGSWIPQLASAGLGLWSGIAGKEDAQQQAAQNQAFLAQQHADKMALEYARLEAAKAGGGGGTDPRVLAIQRQQANDNFFANRARLALESSSEVSNALRGIGASYNRALNQQRVR